MGSPNESEGKLGRKFNRLAHLHRLEILQGILGLLECIERQSRVVLRLFPFVVEVGVLFLQVSRVGKNDAAQIDSWGRRVNRPAKTFFHETRNPAAVVQMRVGQNNRVNLFGRNRRVAPVALAPVLLSLEKPAIDQSLEPAFAAGVTCVDEMFRAGYGTCSAEKLDVGQAFSPALKVSNLPQRHGDTEKGWGVERTIADLRLPIDD